MAVRTKGKTPSFRMLNTDKIPQAPASIELLENKHYGIAIVDASTRKIVFANSRMCRGLGYTRRELEGMNVLRIIAAEDHARLIKAMRARFKGGRAAIGNRYTGIRKSGSQPVVEVYSSPVIYRG